MLSVPNECSLRHIAKQLSIAGIAHVSIYEVDAPYDGQCTAIGIVPLSDRTKLKRIVSNLPLLGSGKSNLACGSKPKPSAICTGSSEAERQE